MPFNVVLSDKVSEHLLQHIEFLSRVSIPAVKRFRRSFSDVLTRLSDNPFQFPFEMDPCLPEGMYRRALFSERYKALFLVSDTTVFLDAVVDCRQLLEPSE